MKHQLLKEFLKEEADRQGITIKELSVSFGLNEGQLYLIMHGRQPGLKVCIDIARHTNCSISYILYLAGHITEQEAGIGKHTPPETDRILRSLAMIQGEPLYPLAVRALMAELDVIMYKMDSE